MPNFASNSFSFRARAHAPHRHKHASEAKRSASEARQLGASVGGSSGGGGTDWWDGPASVAAVAASRDGGGVNEGGAISCWKSSDAESEKAGRWAAADPLDFPPYGTGWSTPRQGFCTCTAEGWRDECERVYIRCMLVSVWSVRTCAEEEGAVGR